MDRDLLPEWVGEGHPRATDHLLAGWYYLQQNRWGGEGRLPCFQAAFGVGEN